MKQHLNLHIELHELIPTNKTKISFIFGKKKTYSKILICKNDNQTVYKITKKHDCVIINNNDITL